MTGKRTRYSAAFNAKVALEAIRGEATVAQPTVKYGVHQTMTSAWKKQAVDGMSGVFSGKAEAAENARDGEVEAARDDRPTRRGAGFFKAGLRTRDASAGARDDRTPPPQAHDPATV